MLTSEERGVNQGGAVLTTEARGVNQGGVLC